MRFVETVQDLLRGSTLTRSVFNRSLLSSGVVKGRVLDIGGTAVPKASYYHYLSIAQDAAVEILNISPNVGADIVADATKLPISDGVYDTILCFNVLEHISHPWDVLAEAHRVSKKQGRIILMVPFLHRVHGDPNDYLRYTESGLRVLLQEANYEVKSIEVLGLGPFMASLAQWQSLMPGWFVLPFFVMVFVFDRLLLMLKPSFKSQWPLGYIVEGLAR